MPYHLKIWLPYVFVLLLSGQEIHAQTRSSLLWEIFGKGLKHSSYLYGTIHSFDSRAFGFAKIAESRISLCDAFGMEINMENMQGANIFGMMKYLTMRGDTTLKMLITDAQYKKLDKYFRDSMGIALGTFNKMKPLFISGLLESKEMSQDSANFLDEYLMKKAEDKDKEIIGIETIEEQVKALDLIPLKEQAAMLMDMVDPDSSKKEQIEIDLVDIYALGNLDSIYSYYKKQDLSNTFNVALITDRNHRMADRIDSIMHQKRLFTAIGAMHLPGEEGVINLLRKKGYRVVAVTKDQ